jgi:mannose-1-phosphate guanylyltransferase
MTELVAWPLQLMAAIANAADRRVHQMLASVPFIPRLDVEPDAARSHVWAIVLTGDTPPIPGRPHRPRSCRTLTHEAPSGFPARPQRILERAGRLAPASQVMTVLTRRQAAAWAPELAALPQAHRVVQPVYRGRAAEVLLPLLKIARHDPSATVIVLPAESGIGHDLRFLRYIGRAVWAVALRPDLPILIGAHPDRPVADGWIEPGEPVEGLEELAVRTVKRFVDDASPAERRQLFDGAALTSTSIFVGRAGTLLALGQRGLPEVLEALEPLQEFFDRPEESLLCEAIYECMPRASLAPLERCAGLAVLALPDVVWRTPEHERPELLAS